jgi:hypothetical protein
MYENRTMKPIELVPRNGEGEEGSVMEGMGLIGVHCVHVQKHHNETPLYNKYMLIKMIKERPLIGSSSLGTTCRERNHQHNI